MISGQQKGFFDLEIKGKLSLFAIYFHPQGLSAFLDLPLSELRDHSVPLKYLAKDVAVKMEDQLALAGDFNKRVAVAESFLMDILKKKETEYKQKRIDRAVHLINRSRGVVDINELAGETCLSRKQFERTFSDVVGASPKQFLRIIRFQNALDQRSRNPILNSTEIAHQCGYYDQAHMISEFKAFTGYTPARYFSECMPFSDYFNTVSG